MPENYWWSDAGWEEAKARFERYFEDLQEPRGDGGFNEVGVEPSREVARRIAEELELLGEDYVLELLAFLVREGPFEQYFMPDKVLTERGVVDREGPRHLIVMRPGYELERRLDRRGLLRWVPDAPPEPWEENL